MAAAWAKGDRRPPGDGLPSRRRAGNAIAAWAGDERVTRRQWCFAPWRGTKSGLGGRSVSIACPRTAAPQHRRLARALSCRLTRQWSRVRSVVAAAGARLAPPSAPLARAQLGDAGGPGWRLAPSRWGRLARRNGVFLMIQNLILDAVERHHQSPAGLAQVLKCVPEDSLTDCG